MVSFTAKVEDFSKKGACMGLWGCGYKKKEKSILLLFKIYNSSKIKHLYVCKDSTLKSQSQVFRHFFQLFLLSSLMVYLAD